MNRAEGFLGGVITLVLASAVTATGAPFEFSPTGSMSAGRSNHTVTLLSNGKMLVAGGVSGNNSLASAELYDPVSGTWGATVSLATTRYYHTATLLPNGKVLVAGGFNSNNPHTSAELFDSPPPVPAAPAEPLASIHIKGKKKVTTSKATCLVKGDASANAVAVQVAVGKGKAAKFRNAKGVSPVWKIKVRLKSGKNLVSARALTADGRFSEVVKITITLQ